MKIKELSVKENQDIWNRRKEWKSIRAIVQALDIANRIIWNVFKKERNHCYTNNQTSNRSAKKN